MAQQNMNLNISLDKTTPILCEECEGATFQQVVYIRKVSKFLTGEPQDGIIPIPSFACTNCHHVNLEFQPKQQEA